MAIAGSWPPPRSLGAALVAEGLLLQLGERSPLERAIFAVEAVAGALLATWLAGTRAVLGHRGRDPAAQFELAVLATIGPALA